MEDMERYGDYNEFDEPPTKNPVTMVIKAIALILCFTVIGFIAFRLIIFNYYPKTMSRLYFNDTLTEYYDATGGDIGALTQKMRFPYDDPDKGHFFCDNLIVIEGAEQIQLSLRFNSALYETLLTECGVDISELGADAFRFSLVRDPITDDGEPIEIAVVSDIVEDSFLMYRYFKLVFDGVELGLDEGEEKVEWLRLEIELLGAKEKTVFAVPIYENNDSYSEFKDYRIAKGECPA